ncbi:MAG: PQQ-like beta-propeller repeat protein [Planctomycetes bacterium]|nr:PQQ-like beta-propeller repeat protein [Planctomycetota bacterium]
MSVRIRVSLALSCLLFPVRTGARADDWPQWGGPKRDCAWRETGVVERFGEGGIPIAWRAPIGPGYAGPAVAEGKVFVTDRRKEEGTERVLCLDAATGKPLWTHAYPCPHKGVTYDYGPRATPTVSKGKVYTVGTMGYLRCLAVEDGHLVWHKEYARDFATRIPGWGVASAPLVDGKRLIANAGGKEGAIVALDKDTGDLLWRALPDQAMGYAPPVIIEAGGGRQLIAYLAEEVASLDPETGRVLWTQPFHCEQELSVVTPVFDGERLFISTPWRGALMMRLAKDRPAATVVWMEESEDGRIEGERGLHALMATPFIRAGSIYGICHYGALRCLDAGTGAWRWSTYEPTGRARWSNAFLIPHLPGGDRVFLANEHGDLIIASLSPEGYREISRAHLIDPTREAGGRPVVWSHPAFARRCVFARNDREILCASLAGKQGPPAAPGYGVDEKK